MFSIAGIIQFYALRYILAPDVTNWKNGKMRKNNAIIQRTSTRVHSWFYWYVENAHIEA